MKGGPAHVPQFGSAQRLLPVRQRNGVHGRHRSGSSCIRQGRPGGTEPVFHGLHRFGHFFFWFFAGTVPGYFLAPFPDGGPWDQRGQRGGAAAHPYGRLRCLPPFCFSFPFYPYQRVSYGPSILLYCPLYPFRPAGFLYRVLPGLRPFFPVPVGHSGPDLRQSFPLCTVVPVPGAGHRGPASSLCDGNGNRTAGTNAGTKSVSSASRLPVPYSRGAAVRNGGFQRQSLPGSASGTFGMVPVHPLCECKRVPAGRVAGRFTPGLPAYGCAPG